MEAKILLIDDKESIRKSLGDYLRREGFEVMLANDGQAGIKKFTIHPPDIVILDVRMPKKDGLEVCREIRQRSGYTPVIMISGEKKEDLDKVVGLTVGADKYILKPFELPVLVAEIKALLRLARGVSSAEHSNQWVQIDSFMKIHRTKRLICAGEREPTLSVLEFDLLMHLIDHAGEPCSRDDLIEYVWKDLTGSVSDTAVNTCIARLRRKIEPDPERPMYIISAHGWGYKFREI
jgi:DNA-binding response OmpR family regulator